jgi:pimeloyl-ACP methyl ester carboxylesterase
MNLQDYCASHVQADEQWIEAAAGVKLRLVSFISNSPKKNPPVFFVAGWVSLMEAWQEVLREMTKEFTVYYLETREKISSQISGSQSFGVEQLGQDLVVIADKLNLKDHNFILFASSLGATAVLDSYQKLIRKPSCLVLVGPNAEFRVPKTWYYIVKYFYPPLYNIIKPSVKWYLRHFRLNIESDAEQYRKYSRSLDAGDPRKLKKALLALSSYQIWPRLAEISCPALIIGASEDKLHEPENLKKMVDLLPAAEYIDLRTNMRTHSSEMVSHFNTYVQRFRISH